MMKRILPLLMALLCLLPAARADGPRPFDDRYLTMGPQELAACMENAMAGADLPGAKVCQYPDGRYVLTRVTQQDVFCVARRTDGLLTLCCFVPHGGTMSLAWHNDLLLSYYQSLSFGESGAAWSGGLLPSVMTLQDSSFLLQLDLMENVSLLLECDGYHGDWTVQQLGVYTAAADGRLMPLLAFRYRDLADWCRLSCCHPGNWLETEEASW